jgi:hypothetical protein
VVKVSEKISTHLHTSLVQDVTVGSVEKTKKKKFMLHALEVAVLECFLVKHSQGILGDNP